MQCASNNKIVLVTGLNSYVGAHVAYAFLCRGWSVRATTRSRAKYDSIVGSKAFSPYSSRMQFVCCEDLVQFDWTDALKGVTAVAHVASPAHFEGTSVDDYVKPAVEGTRNLLEACTKEACIKHVVVTSSVAAVVDTMTPANQQGGKTYTESNWNSITMEQAQATNDKYAWYCVSKTCAERALMDIASRAKFTCSVICPSLVVGPLCAPQEITKLTAAVNFVWMMMSGACDRIPDPIAQHMVDVRDVAFAHVESAERCISGRFILSAAEFDNVWMAEFCAKKFPAIAHRVPKPAPGQTSLMGKNCYYNIDGSKAERELGFQYRAMDKSLEEMMAQLLEFEKLQANSNPQQKSKSMGMA